MKPISLFKISSRLNKEIANYLWITEAKLGIYNKKNRPLEKKRLLFQSGKYMEYIEHFVLLKNSKKD